MTSTEDAFDLLHPKVRILLFIYRGGNVEFNISELARRLSYEDDAYVNKLVHTMINNGMIKVVVKNNKEYLTLTNKGRKKIDLLILPHYLLVFILLVSITPLFYAWYEAFYNLYISPIILTGLGTILLLSGIALTIMHRRLEQAHIRRLPT